MIILILALLPLLSPCPLDYFQSSSSSCLKCNATCETCSSLSTCLTCRAGTYMLNGFTCLQCPFGCASCLSSSQCSSCESGFYLDSNKQCQSCADNCRSCTGPDNLNCLTCKSGSILNKTLGTCLKLDSNLRCNTIDGCDFCPDTVTCKSCRPGFYVSPDGKSCGLCDKSCGNCFGHANYECSDCNPGGQLAGGECTYSCSPSCKTCFGILDSQCLTCVGLEVLDRNYCIDKGCLDSCLQCDFNPNTPNSYTCSSCLDGSYLLGSNCQDCPGNCSKCTDSIHCQQCTIGYYLSTNSLCLDCGNGCYSCSSGGTCAVCNDGYYMNNGQCLQCNSSCRTCSGGDATQCLSCHRDSVLTGTHCLQVILQGGEDGLTVTAMKLIIGFTASAAGLGCIITVVYKISKNDPFYKEVEKEVQEEFFRRKSGVDGAMMANSNALSDSPPAIISSNNSDLELNEPPQKEQPNYAGLTVVIDKKPKKKEKKEKQEEEEEKKEETSKKGSISVEEKIKLETISESMADEEKSSIFV